MFKIGEFSSFSRVSVKMLRHYDALGLLVPARVDSETGYRYYTAVQLTHLNRILALRDLGFSLEQVKRMLGDSVSVEQMRGMLTLRRAEIEQQVQVELARLNQVAQRLAMLEEQAYPPYEVLVRELPAQRVATWRQVVGRVGGGVTIAQMFERAEAVVAGCKARAASPPLLLFHEVEYVETARDVEVAIPITKEVRGGLLECRVLPAHTAACLVHTGAYETIPHAFERLLRWVEQNDYRVVRPWREAYLRFGAELAGYDLPRAYLAASAAEYVTELQLPVEKQR